MNFFRIPRTQDGSHRSYNMGAIESVMDLWYKQENDALCHQLAILTLDKRTLEMRLDLARANIHRLNRTSTALQTTVNALNNRTNRAENILHEIFTLDPFLRNFYSSAIQFADLPLNDPLDAESTLGSDSDMSTTDDELILHEEIEAQEERLRHREEDV